CNSITSKIGIIKNLVLFELSQTNNNAIALNTYLREKVKRKVGLQSSIDGIISQNELNDANRLLDDLINRWMTRLRQASSSEPSISLKFRKEGDLNESLFISISDDNHPD